MLVNVKLDGKRDYLSRLQTLLVFQILNGTAKTKLVWTIFYCVEIVDLKFYWPVD